MTSDRKDWASRLDGLKATTVPLWSGTLEDSTWRSAPHRLPTWCNMSIAASWTTNWPSMRAIWTRTSWLESVTTYQGSPESVWPKIPSTSP